MKVQIGLIWVTVFVLVIVAVLAASIRMTMEARRSKRAPLPKVRHVSMLERTGDETVKPLTLLMEPSRFFGVNILVTIFYVNLFGDGHDATYEQTIGIGQVVNIQENGLIQVLVLREMSDHAALWQRIRKPEMATLSQVVIKPSIDFNRAGIEVRFND